jgi:hypothetical protein
MIPLGFTIGGSTYVCTEDFFVGLKRLLLALFTAGSAHAVFGADHANMINEDNINLSAGRFLADFVSKDAAIRSAARLYLLGVLDASEGRQWCSYTQIKTASINDFLFDSLRKRSSEELNLRAATLIVDTLKKSFPCGAKDESSLPKAQK